MPCDLKQLRLISERPRDALQDDNDYGKSAATCIVVAEGATTLPQIWRKQLTCHLHGSWLLVPQRLNDDDLIGSSQNRGDTVGQGLREEKDSAAVLSDTTILRSKEYWTGLDWLWAGLEPRCS